MAAQGKRIGFVDNKLDNFHANTYLKIARGQLAACGFDVAGCIALDADAGRQWAAKNNVPYFATPAELNEHVDFFAVLAPSSPQTHMQLCQWVLPFGKPTFVDKTFAPDAATAQRIFDLADEHAAPVATSSALRYTSAQKHVAAIGGPGAVRHMVAFGPAGSFDEYAIHPLEMIISCMGPDVTQVLRREAGCENVVLLNFAPSSDDAGRGAAGGAPGGSGRSATVALYTDNDAPYAASITTAKKTDLLTMDLANLFADALGGMLDLFESGKPNVDRRETLAIMRILDAARKPEARTGFVKV